MKTFFKFLVGGFAIVGLLVVLMVAGVVTLVAAREKIRLPQEIVLTLDLKREIKEKSEGGPLELVRKSNDMTLRDMLATLDFVSRDPRVKIVIGDLRGEVASLAGVQELRNSIEQLRDAGKATYAFSTSFGEFGPGDHAYYLASAFQHIWLQPLGLVGITGLGAQMPFAKEALKKIGAEADFVHREEYKTAMDMLTEDDFTPANAEMLNAVLDDISGRMVSDIAADRALEPLRLQYLIDEAPLTAPQAYSEHIVDRIGYLDEIEDWALKNLGDKSKLVDADEYLRLRRAELKAMPEIKPLPVIAVVEGVGQIVQDAEGSPGSSSLISADKMAEAIKDAVEDKKVELILLRLDSPGGSAVASESIRRALELAEDSGVPVVVSMGGTAGSGAYWVAAAGDYVFADPSTLTGSIGVIAGKVAGTDVWDKLGIHWGMITRGANADLWTITAPFTPEQRAKVDALVGETYDAFKNVVAEGRDLDPAYVAQIAKGRVWTGQQAFELGLVDELGGFYDSIRYAKSLLGLSPDSRVTLKLFPKEESAGEKLIKLLDRLGSVSSGMQDFGRLTKMLESVFAPILDLLQTQPRMLKMPDVERRTL